MWNQPKHRSPLQAQRSLECGSDQLELTARQSLPGARGGLEHELCVGLIAVGGLARCCQLAVGDRDVGCAMRLAPIVLHQEHGATPAARRAMEGIRAVETSTPCGDAVDGEEVGHASNNSGND
jgi:hypothetical protein